MRTEYALYNDLLGLWFWSADFCSMYEENARRYPTMTEAELGRIKYGLADYSVVPVEGK